MPGYRVIIPYRIKVLYERDVISELRMPPDLPPLMSPTSWKRVLEEIKDRVSELWEEAKASVDITPGDGCPHSDNMIID